LARKILLADDSVTAQNMGRKILADAGYDVITVNNGSAALKKIAELKPELIILDVYMPGYSGLEVCQRLKDSGETSRIPVLLTVGKLEPFKPEEAKRVRAEGYIVKPFEASELLSAVSKLEDKIVPRAESGKPGRLARAVAVVDEGGRSGDEPEAEGSWKDRIAFPAKKQEVAEASTDNADLYNTINRDLKTVVQRDEPARQSAPVVQDRRVKSVSSIVKPEEKLVDLGALATPGLPKDVTAEEIAALAAAAAQVKGTKLEAESAAKPPAEEKVANEPVGSLPLVKDTAFKQIRTDATVVRPDVTHKAVAAQPAQEIPAQVRKAPATPTEDEVSEAIACLEREQAHGAEQLWNVIPANDAQQSAEKEDLPVTMVGSGDARGIESPRWTAVPVAVDPQEAALSLEREMQMAFRAFSAAAAAQAGPATVVEEPAQDLSVPTVAPHTAPVDSTVMIPDPELKTEPAPAVEVSAAVCEEAPRAEGNEFAVASDGIADHSEQSDFSAAEHLQPSSAVAENVISQVASPDQITAEVAVTAAMAQQETQQPQTTLEAITISAGMHEPAPELIGDIVVPEVSSAESMIQMPVSATWAAEPSASEAFTGEQPLPELSVPEKPVPEPAVSSGLVSDGMPASETGLSETVVSEIVGGEASEPAVAEAPMSGVGETADKNRQAAKPVSQENLAQDEKELAASTAAAWASWRQIRDAVPGSRNETSGSSEDLKDRALAAHALAVAAGAESTPSEVATKAAPDVNSQTVASIVDSLLAELRPRIVEEISRKLATEKK
jgi:two-component system chemotaxis response regulator CheY